MRISDWSSDVCSSDLSEHEKHIGLFRSDRVGSAHRDFHARRIEIVLQRVAVDQEIKLAGTDAEIVEQGVALGRRAIAGDLQALRDRKSTRLNSVTNAHLVCRLLLEK